jgi:hypothetical protein
MGLPIPHVKLGMFREKSGSFRRWAGRKTLLDASRRFNRKRRKRHGIA